MLKEWSEVAIKLPFFVSFRQLQCTNQKALLIQRENDYRWHKSLQIDEVLFRSISK
jgi:hypothetical protein